MRAAAFLPKAEFGIGKADDIAGIEWPTVSHRLMIHISSVGTPQVPDQQLSVLLQQFRMLARDTLFECTVTARPGSWPTSAGNVFIGMR